MLDDTDIGGTRESFPRTNITALRAAQTCEGVDRARALGTLIAAYWKPVYKYIRVKWSKSNEDAKDLTQGFFATVVEKDFFASFDPARARFRTFLRVCLDSYLKNEHKSAQRLKRGGNAQILSMDFDGADDELCLAGLRDIPSSDSPDRYFDDEWTRHLFSLAVDELRTRCKASGKTVPWRVFERYDLQRDGDAEKISYGDLATHLGISITDVTNHLAGLRKEFRNIVFTKIRDLTATDEEYRQELIELLGTGNR